MMKKILLLGLLLTSACGENSNSGSNATKTNGAGVVEDSVEFYLQNEAARNAKSDICNGRFAPVTKEVMLECRNFFEADAREDVRFVIPGVPTVEEFIKSERAIEVAGKFCIKNRFSPLYDKDPFKTIPFEDPICQNLILAMEQLYQKCGKDPSMASSKCSHLARDLEKIKNYKP